MQISQKESEGLLQESLDEVREELCNSQANYQRLQIDLEKAKEQQFDFAGEKLHGDNKRIVFPL